MSYRLNVPYLQKDDAKRKGAKWNYTEKYWYCEELTDALRRWYEGDEIEAGASDASTEPFAEYQTVSEVNRMIAERFDATDCFQSILVKGEVTNYRGTNGGHYYFSVKDENSLLSCVMWSSTAERILQFTFEAGKKVAIIGSFKYCEKNGTGTLHVRQIADMGAGEANLRFLELKARLEEEGLFAVEHKKPIPKFPQRVGIVTSRDGDARKDIEKVAGKRNPYVQLILYHANVQGQNAIRTMIEGIERLDAMQLDTIIVSRGGGSQEDVIVYNDEALARAVYNARTPVVTAVGHESYWTLIDYVADKRVATPSEAAEETIPDVMSVIRQIRQLERNISNNMRSALHSRMQKLKTQEARLEGNDPVRRLKERKDRLNHLSEGLQQKIRMLYETKKNRFRILLERLNGLSPTAKLVRGFGYISHDGKPLTSVGEVKSGDRLDIRIHDGQIVTTVKETQGTS